ncbi:hypothetical protein [Bradyrhizobium australiense]|uniref:hypothetical protein n=1 Tax=Bradyrhizobium australiense TaxID=2721161 RepID=UPI001AEECE29
MFSPPRRWGHPGDASHDHGSAKTPIVTGIDTEVGERHDVVVTDTEDPDEAILWIHPVRHVTEPVLVFAKVLCDATDCEDGMTFIDVHDYAA